MSLITQFVQDCDSADRFCGAGVNLKVLKAVSAKVVKLWALC
jgi:hypothetical protein